MKKSKPGQANLRPRGAKSKQLVKALRGGKAARRADGAPKVPRRTADNNFLVVGLGASAGGLEATRKLLAALPANTGFAFILIQHLEPGHKSMLADLLARDTKMKVTLAAAGMPITPNCIYINPPQTYLAVSGEVLRVSRMRGNFDVHLPFNFLLNSLAEEYSECAVGVVLSGTGADGSIGVKAISERGGFVIAQQPEEAAFDGMPRNAIATGAVNLVLPAAKIPRALIRYAQHPYVTARLETEQPSADAENLVSAIVSLLRTRAGHDFSHYKKTTLNRRIQRRMAAVGVRKIRHYIEILRKNDDELELLAKNLLIHVTRFFRDPPAFEALAKKVIPKLVREHAKDQPIRVWVPGCSTGEEAYSLAMLFFEEFGAEKQNPNLRMFASDLDVEAVNYARNGVYPGSIKTDISAKRLDRFFIREDQSYRVKHDLRESVTFAAQNVLQDPPFLRVDLISCRNLLIYLQPEEQERALLLFHYALVQGGFLFLGASETIGNLTEHFGPVADTLRVFRRIGRTLPRESGIASNVVMRGRSLWPRVMRQVEPRRSGFSEIVQQLLLKAYAPAAVLVNRKYQGLYFFGPIDRYLRVVAGEPSPHLPAMLRDGLAFKFRAAVRQASQGHTTTTISGAHVKRHGVSVMVTIAARPVKYEGEELLLVTFVDAPEQKPVITTESKAETFRVEQLEEELETTRKDLENTIRELEASNQELRALNEEAASMNEEFQSTNEELETAREELQSVNEEVVRVNNELQKSLEQERHTTDDLQNILNSSDIATIFLDVDLNVRVFTPAAAPLFNLITTDIGRPLADLATRFEGIDLIAAAHGVIERLKPIKREVLTASGNWFICSVAPYRAQNDRIEGVVINFSDISELKASEQGLRAAHTYTKAIVNTIHEPLVVVDDKLRVISASESFYRVFGASPEDTLGRPLPDTDAGHLDTPAFRAFLDRVKSGDHSVHSYEVAIDLSTGNRRVLAVTAEPVHDIEPIENRVLISFVDITEFKHSAELLAAAKRTAEQANLAKSRFLAAVSHDLRQPLQALSFLRGAARRMLVEKDALALLDQADRVSEGVIDMLNALLDINQIENGLIQPVIVDCSIKELFEALENEFAEQAKRKGLVLRVISCGCNVRSDRRLLKGMLSDLISNALRYTDKGKILLGCRRREGRARIEVWDTGIGIPKDELAHIFEEYHQASAEERRGGLGLGLAIVQRLGELLSHPVSVHSRVGKGSVFSIEAPLAGTTPLRDRLEESSHQGGGQVGTILVIEDEASVRESLMAMLRAEGHRVTAAANGQTALNLVARNRIRPDLAICDYNLPGGLTGVQTADALRSFLGPSLRAIIMSGDVRRERQRDITGKGYISVTKPIRASELVQLIERLFRGEQPEEKPSISAPDTEHAGVIVRTVFVVDDDRDTRESLRALLNSAGYLVKAYSSAPAFLNSGQLRDRGCIITDVRMPGMNGLEMLAQLAARGSDLRAIVITGQGDIQMAVHAMQAGAVDFIEKPVNSDALLTSVHRALQQASNPAERSAGRAEAAMRIAGLTKREREVMDLVVAGHANKEIAFRLGINQRTVEVHRAAVMKKMGAESLPDLVRQVIRASGRVSDEGIDKGS